MEALTRGRMGVLIILNASKIFPYVLVLDGQRKQMLDRIPTTYPVVLFEVWFQFSLINLPYMEAKMPHLHI